MTAVFITVYRQRTQPKINEERSVQGQINQIILDICAKLFVKPTRGSKDIERTRNTGMFNLRFLWKCFYINMLSYLHCLLKSTCIHDHPEAMKGKSQLICRISTFDNHFYLNCSLKAR